MNEGFDDMGIDCPLCGKKNKVFLCDSPQRMQRVISGVVDSRDQDRRKVMLIKSGLQFGGLLVPLLLVIFINGMRGTKESMIMFLSMMSGVYGLIFGVSLLFHWKYKRIEKKQLQEEIEQLTLAGVIGVEGDLSDE